MIGGVSQTSARRLVEPAARASAAGQRSLSGEAPLSVSETATIATPAQARHWFSPAVTGYPPFGRPSAAFMAQVIALRADTAPQTAAAWAAQRRAAVAAYRAQVGEYAHILGPVRPFAFRA